MEDARNTRSLIEALRKRTETVLPNDWKKGRQCPGCDSQADRPKCFFDMGGHCPRHYPSEYEPSPFVEIPDELCQAAADALETFEDRHRQLLDDMKSEIADLKGKLAAAEQREIGAICVGRAKDFEHRNLYAEVEALRQILLSRDQSAVDQPTSVYDKAVTLFDELKSEKKD